MGPGQVAAEADVDQRQTGQRGPHHVEPAGNGQVHLVETHRAVPGEVRVGQEHALAVRRTFAANGNGVAAALQAEALAPLLGDLERLLAAQGDLLRSGRRGGHQRVGELADPAFDQQAPGQAQQVIGRDGPQPGLAKATGGLAVGLAEEAVETGGVAFEQLAYRGRLRLPEGLQRLGLVEPGVEDVGRQVVQLGRRLALAAEIARPLAARGDDLLGQQAGVVARVGVADAIAQAALILGPDVRHAIGGPADIRGQPGRPRHIGLDRHHRTQQHAGQAGQYGTHPHRCRFSAKWWPERPGHATKTPCVPGIPWRGNGQHRAWRRGADQLARACSCRARAAVPGFRCWYREPEISSARTGSTDSRVSLRPWLAWQKPCM